MLFNFNNEIDLEKVSILVECIVALIGALSGGGLIFFVQNKRLKEIQVQREESDEWVRLYDQSNKKCDELLERNQKISDEKMKMFDEVLKLKEEIGNLKIKVKELEVCKCVRFACTERQPPKMTYVLKAIEKEEGKND